MTLQSAWQQSVPPDGRLQCARSLVVMQARGAKLSHLHAQDLAAPAPPHLGAVLGASHFVGRMQTTRPTDMPASFDSAAELLHGLLEELTADAPQVGISGTAGGSSRLFHHESDCVA